MDAPVAWFIGAFALYGLIWLALAFANAERHFGRARAVADTPGEAPTVETVPSRAPLAIGACLPPLAIGLGAAMVLGYPAVISDAGMAGLSLAAAPIAMALAMVVFWPNLLRLADATGSGGLAGLARAYYQSRLLAGLVMALGLFVIVALAALALNATGLAFHVLTNGQMGGWGAIGGLWFVAGVALLLAGNRAAIAIVPVQVVIIVLGVVALAAAMLAGKPPVLAGLAPDELEAGLARLAQALAALGAADPITTPAGHSHWLAAPGVIQFVSEAARAVGGSWTGVAVLGVMAMAMGLACAPALVGLALARTQVRGVTGSRLRMRLRQIGGLAFFLLAGWLGALVIFGLGAIGLLARVSGGLAARPSTGAATDAAAADTMTLVPGLIVEHALEPAWLFGLVAMAVLAALHLAGAGLLAAGGAWLARDGLAPALGLNPGSVRAERLGRFGILITAVATVLWLAAAPDVPWQGAGLALALGCQMLPLVLGLSYVPGLTGRGLIVGLVAGCVAVLATDSVGQAALAGLGVDGLGLGAWPLTIAPAFWGLAANIAVAAVLSAVLRDEVRVRHRMGLLRARDGLSAVAHGNPMPATDARLSATGWAVLAWLFFAAGPGLVIGNTLFGFPNRPVTWLFGVPSLWAYVAVAWIAGLGVLALAGVRSAVVASVSADRAEAMAAPAAVAVRVSRAEWAPAIAARVAASPPAIDQPAVERPAAEHVPTAPKARRLSDWLADASPAAQTEPASDRASASNEPRHRGRRRIALWPRLRPTPRNA